MRYGNANVYPLDQKPYYAPNGDDYRVIVDMPSDKVAVPIQFGDLSQTHADEKNLRNMENQLAEMSRPEDINYVASSGKYLKDPRAYFDPTANEKAMIKAKLIENIQNMRQDLLHPAIPNIEIENVSSKPKVQNYSNKNKEETNEIIANSYYYPVQKDQKGFDLAGPVGSNVKQMANGQFVSVTDGNSRTFNELAKDGSIIGVKVEDEHAVKITPTNGVVFHESSKNQKEQQNRNEGRVFPQNSMYVEADENAAIVTEAESVGEVLGNKYVSENSLSLRQPSLTQAQSINKVAVDAEDTKEKKKLNKIAPRYSLTTAAVKDNHTNFSNHTNVNNGTDHHETKINVFNTTNNTHLNKTSQKDLSNTQDFHHSIHSSANLSNNTKQSNATIFIPNAHPLPKSSKNNATNATDIKTYSIITNLTGKTSSMSNYTKKNNKTNTVNKHNDEVLSKNILDKGKNVTNKSSNDISDQIETNKTQKTNFTIPKAPPLPNSNNTYKSNKPSNGAIASKNNSALQNKSISDEVKIGKPLNIREMNYTTHLNDKNTTEHHPANSTKNYIVNNTAEIQKKTLQKENITQSGNISQQKNPHHENKTHHHQSNHTTLNASNSLKANNSNYHESKDLYSNLNTNKSHKENKTNYHESSGYYSNKDNKTKNDNYDKSNNTFKHPVNSTQNGNSSKPHFNGSSNLNQPINENKEHAGKIKNISQTNNTLSNKGNHTSYHNSNNPNEKIENKTNQNQSHIKSVTVPKPQQNNPTQTSKSNNTNTHSIHISLTVPGIASGNTKQENTSNSHPQSKNQTQHYNKGVLSSHMLMNNTASQHSKNNNTQPHHSHSTHIHQHTHDHSKHHHNSHNTSNKNETNSSTQPNKHIPSTTKEPSLHKPKQSAYTTPNQNKQDISSSQATKIKPVHTSDTSNCSVVTPKTIEADITFESVYSYNQPAEPEVIYTRSEPSSKKMLRKSSSQVILDGGEMESSSELNTQGLKVEKVKIIPRRKLIQNSEEESN